VRANDQTPLVVINQISPIYVSFGIPENVLPELRRYMAMGALQVEATPTGDTSPPAIGRVSFVDNAVDQTTGSIKVKATFANTNRQLWPGQFVNIAVRLSTDRSALVVPTAAVQTGPTGQYVFLVKQDKTVAMQPITVARATGPDTIIKSGLNVGDVVVTDGQLRLVPGSRISIKNAAAPKVQS
jgi:multidrug efflux system membrane fusion protein